MVEREAKRTDKPPPPAPSGRRAVLGVAATTAVVTAASYGLPEGYAATGVAVVFLAATWALVLRHDDKTIRRYGLPLGGLLAPVPLKLGHVLREATSALGWALLFAVIFLIPFWIGFRIYWDVEHFIFRPPDSMLDEVAGQLLVIALPEEVFYRGFLQSELDGLWKKRARVLGADIGMGLVVSAAVFAVGHVLTNPNPARLAVFFPALLFGWLRARTGGVGSSIAFHAMCNLFSATLSRGYGLSS